MESRLITDISEINSLYDFIRTQNLNYPQYDEWAKKCRDELLTGYKKAFAMIVAGKNREPIVVGSIIAQPHKKDPSVLELKNGRVHTQYAKKGCFKNIYLDVERYARENGYRKILLDAHADNFEMISLMQKLGYIIECRENLYTNKSLELVMTKDLSLTKLQTLEMVVIDSARKAMMKIRLLMMKFLKVILIKNE